MIHSLKEDGRPATQWYWDDWFSSHDVQSCSLAAQGLWVNLLGIMFSSEIRGTLTINGRPVDNKIIAKRFGHHLKEVNKLITELEASKVFSRLEDGTIYSRRMYRESVRQQEISQKRAEAGKAGMAKRWGEEDNKPITPPDNKTITKITASSSTSSSSPTSTSKILSRESMVDSHFPGIHSLWNEFATNHNLAQITGIKNGTTRYRHLKERMKEKDFDFPKILAIIKDSPFLLGQTKEPFFVTFDWLICPSNFDKVKEGNYLKREGKYQPFGIKLSDDEKE